MAAKPISIYGQVAHSFEAIPLCYSIPLFIVVFFLGIVIKRRYLSPLRRFPGLFWASVTRWWLVHQIFRGDHEKTMLRLHAKYGPIIRISPFEVAISDPDAIKTIYGHTSQFTKVALYYQMSLIIRANGIYHGITRTLGTLHCLRSVTRRSMHYDAGALPMLIV
jgi:hypothetical protein